MAKKSKSSQRWLKEHFSDTYVKQAQQAGYRSRAVYKLLELQERDKLFRPGMTVIDLGAAPGGWAQLVTKLVGSKGRVIAMDILPIEPMDGVECLQGDFRDDAIIQQLLTCIDHKNPVDWVISDMAPNMSGIDSVDQPRSIELAELALDFAVNILTQHTGHPSKGFLAKVFQGTGTEAFIAEVRKCYKKLIIRKPKASRDRSREVYMLAR